MLPLSASMWQATSTSFCSFSFDLQPGQDPIKLCWQGLALLVCAAQMNGERPSCKTLCRGTVRRKKASRLVCPHKLVRALAVRLRGDVHDPLCQILIVGLPAYLRSMSQPQQAIPPHTGPKFGTQPVLGWSTTSLLIICRLCTVQDCWTHQHLM